MSESDSTSVVPSACSTTAVAPTVAIPRWPVGSVAMTLMRTLSLRSMRGDDVVCTDTVSGVVLMLISPSSTW